MVELGCIDIVTEVFMQSSYLAYPHEGHLQIALHVMGYLQLKHEAQLIFDPTYLDIDLSAFPQYEWTEFYGNVKEAISPDIPPPLGKDVKLCMMVDSDHEGDKATRCFRTSFLIFCNVTPFIWLSNK